MLNGNQYYQKSELMKFFIPLLGSLGLVLIVFACTNSEKEDKKISKTGNPTIDALTLEIEKQPEDHSLYAERAYIYYENEGYDEAIADLQKALDLDSTKLEYLHLLADVYLDYFQSRKALETMKKAVALHPESIYTMLKLSEFQLILKKYQESVSTIEEVLKKDPLNADAFFMYGLNLKEQGKTEQAVKYFQEAVENDPDLIDGWINIGQLQEQLNNPKAIEYFNTAIEIDPSNIEAMHAKAMYLQNTEQLEAAISIYRQINRINPQYVEAYLNAGLLYLDLDSMESAFNQFEIATKVDPVHVKAYYYKGVAAEFLGNFKVAEQNYRQALKFNPDYEKAQEALNDVSQKLQIE